MKIIITVVAALFVKVSQIDRKQSIKKQALPNPYHTVYDDHDILSIM